MDATLNLGFFCVISAVITYGLGVFVYAKNPDSRVNRLFLLVNLGASYWALGEFMIWSENTYENVWFWLKVSSFWTLVIVMCIHFILTFADHPLAQPERFKCLFCILYIPALFISFLNIFTENIFTIAYSSSSHYYYTPAVNSPVYYISAIYFFLIFLWAFWVGYKARISAGKDKFKLQANTVSIGLLILLVLGSESGIVLPMLGVYTPNLVFIGILLFSMTISYAILRYGLFILTPETVATNIIQTMPDGVILTDINGNVITSNNYARKLLSYSWKPEDRKHTGQPIPEPVYSKIRDLIQKEGMISDYELIPVKNEPTTLSISGSLVKDPYGQPAGMVLIIHDITERKSTEKILRIANEKISLLNRITRHDISNLITALAGYLEVLKDEDDEDTRNHMISSSIGIVDKITHQLQFSREYQNIGVHDAVWLPLKEITEKAKNDIHHDKVHISNLVDDVEIFADPLSMKVVYNLLENAIRHGTGLTRIDISSQVNTDGSFRIIIENDGTGIKPEEKKLIFNHGYGKNTGLGLTLSRDILAVTGISIIENGEFMKGARFEIIVPPASWRQRNPKS